MRLRASFLSLVSIRSYGKRAPAVQRHSAALALGIFALVWMGGMAGAGERTIKIVAVGDSLSAGYQLPAQDAFPIQLEKALKEKGLAVEVANAGVSGDTSTGGLARLDWSVPDGTDAVILELGANDMLRAIDPKVTREALTEIVRRLKARNIEVLLCGMLAPRNLGTDYTKAFDSIYPDLASQNGLLLYPFFLDGIATDAKLNQRDGMHPTTAGVAKIVQGILPKVEELMARVRAKTPS